jgi:hypothetical protein
MWQTILKKRGKIQFTELKEAVLDYWDSLSIHTKKDLFEMQKEILPYYEEKISESIIRNGGKVDGRIMHSARRVYLGKKLQCNISRIIIKNRTNFRKIKRARLNEFIKIGE